MIKFRVQKYKRLSKTVGIILFFVDNVDMRASWPFLTSTQLE